MGLVCAAAGPRNQAQVDRAGSAGATGVASDSGQSSHPSSELSPDTFTTGAGDIRPGSHKVNVTPEAVLWKYFDENGYDRKTTLDNSQAMSEAGQ